MAPHAMTARRIVDPRVLNTVSRVWMRCPGPSGRWIVVLLFAALWPESVAGQEGFVFRSYQRIRVTASQLGHYDLTGRLMDIGSGRLRMRGVNLNYEVTIPISMLERFEVSRGKNKVLTIGAPLVGLALGALLGPVLLTESDRCRGAGDIAPECRKVTPDAVVGGVAGFGFFAISSQILVPERWREVLATELGWSDSGPGMPGNESIRLGLRLRF